MCTCHAKHLKPRFIVKWLANAPTVDVRRRMYFQVGSSCSFWHDSLFRRSSVSSLWSWKGGQGVSTEYTQIAVSVWSLVSSKNPDYWGEAKQYVKFHSHSSTVFVGCLSSSLCSRLELATCPSLQHIHYPDSCFVFACSFRSPWDAAWHDKTLITWACLLFLPEVWWNFGLQQS